MRVAARWITSTGFTVRRSGSEPLITELGGTDRSPVETCILDRHSRSVRQRFGQTKIVLSENARQRRGAEKKRAKGLSPHQERHRHERCDTSGQECLQGSRPLCKRLDVL